jgi:uncharacterized protein (DUF983 family)
LRLQGKALEEFMADVARNLDPRAVEPRKLEREEQYWSPSLDRRPMTASEIESCPRCGTDFIIGSRFCYVCGSDRDLPGKARRSSGIEWKRWLDIRELQNRMGMGTASLVAFVIGCVSLFAAMLTGLMFTATTMIDWQAVQLWRAQWLLAAIAAFVAGILLKKPLKAD